MKSHCYHEKVFYLVESAPWQMINSETIDPDLLVVWLSDILKKVGVRVLSSESVPTTNPIDSLIGWLSMNVPADHGAFACDYYVQSISYVSPGSVFGAKSDGLSLGASLGYERAIYLHAPATVGELVIGTFFEFLAMIDDGMVESAGFSSVPYFDVAGLGDDLLLWRGNSFGDEAQTLTVWERDKEFQMLGRQGWAEVRKVSSSQYI